MKPNIFIIALAILAITAIEICAILKGVDGKIMAMTVLAIGGLAGYKAKDAINGFRGLFK